MKLKLSLLILGLNFAVVLVVGGIVYSSVWMGKIIFRGNTGVGEQAGGGERQGESTVSFELDKKTLLDRDKTMSKVDEMKEKIFKIRNDDPNSYTRLPESEFLGSLFAYFFLSRIAGGKEVVLDEEMIKEFRNKGTLLYSMDKQYPLMKRSIYIDRSRKTPNKPVVRPGTNIIMIFVESLSDFFLREEIHGIKGLTPNFRDMERESFRFSNMYNASFPTLKGLIASLGSCIYLLDESIGSTRIPVPCRFLFISDILKTLDYTTIHIQAGSERFIGMKDIFTKRQSYDYFYGAESLTIDNITSMKRGFGVDDDTLFDYIIGWLEKYQGSRPLFLTISTINSHPPFKVKSRHPGAGDNDMLNALYSTDRAFGKFWNYFKKSKYANNTLLLVTADHAMGNNKEYIKFMKHFEDHYRPFFDVIPCFLHFPGGALKGVRNDTSCNNLDITPTVLDMMNIDLPNPFMGLSIFSERPFYSKKGGDLGKGLELKGSYDQKQIAKAKKLIGFYINLYRQDRILPKDFQVKLYR
ncbi:MAG: LTA synthase family protein [Spirochaetes bacterium]|nr:LTA synthase family protein [Spirochaetota bacterium]